MPILYSAVAHNRCVLSKYASCEGNFREIVEEVISKIPNKDHKMTYLHGPYLFNYISEDGYLYFCITARSCQRSRAFLYLNEIKRRFSTNNKKFCHVLASEMQRYSEDYSTIVVRKGEIDELNSIGVDSSENILGEKLLYVDNPDSLCFSITTCVDQSPQQSIISHDSQNYSTDSNIHTRINESRQVPEDNELPDVQKTHKQLIVKYFLIIVTVIICVICIRTVPISYDSPVYLSIIACVLVLILTRLSKKDKEI